MMKGSFDFLINCCPLRKCCVKFQIFQERGKAEKWLFE